MEFNFNKLATEMWEKKHFSEEDNSIDDVFHRVAKNVASVEKDSVYWEEEFYKLLSSMKLIAGGRIYNGAGTKNNYLLNCFFEPIPDSLEGIMEANKRSAMIFKKNGGVGYNFSSLRPKDYPLSKGGTSSGSVSFMKMFDAAGETIKSGGYARRAAQIAVLDVDHGDIEEFIQVKREEGKLQNFNISVGITEKFINAVKNDEDWDIGWKGNVTKTIKAKDLWSKFIKSQYNFNDPGFLNLTEINKYNNMYYEYELNGVNPCGEITLPPFGVCCLSNINLTQFVTKSFSDISYKNNFDVGSYMETLNTSVRFLDNVLDVTDYPYPENEERAKTERRIGLNPFSGLASTLAMLKLPYDSVEAIEFINWIGEIATNFIYSASVRLSKEKGSFDKFDKDKFMESNFIKEKLSDAVKNEISIYGIRNCALMTIPPVGTGSLLANNISSGLEPIFAIQYERKVRQADNTFTYETVEDYAWNLYKQIYKDHKVPDYFKTAREIDPMKHIDVQSACQYWIDQSISKTCNIPNEYSIEDYEKLVLYSFDKGCKGFTSFRTGTREGVLSTKEEREKSEKEIKQDQKEFFGVWEGHDGNKVFCEVELPDEYPCKGYILKSEGRKFYLHASFKDKKKTKPFALFVHTNNKESNITTYTALEKLELLARQQGIPEEHITKNKMKCGDQNNINKLARTISLLLRHNVNIKVIVELLDSIEEIPVFSFIYRIKKFLSKFIIECQTGEKCPDCNGDIIYQGGCKQCSNCGWSKC